MSSNKRTLANRREKFIDSVIKKFGSKFDFPIMEFKNMTTKVTFQCAEHGCSITVYPNNFLRSKGTQCPKCRATKSTRMREFCCALNRDPTVITCDTCKKKRKAKYKIQFDDNKICAWTYPDKRSCTHFVTAESNKYCRYHINCGADKDNGIHRCTSNGCRTILEKDYKHTRCKKHLLEMKEYNRNKRKKRLIIRNLPAPDKNFQEWLGGFFDGDGSVMIHESDTGFRMCVTFFQCHIPSLKNIELLYPGGKHYTDIRMNRAHCKPGFILQYNGINARHILADMKATSILKLRQIVIALQYIEICNLHGPEMLEKKRSFTNQISECKKQYHKSMIIINRLTSAYVAGLFDAEGCIKFNNRCVSVTLAQKGSPAILTALSKKYGGYHRGKDWIIWKHSVLITFLNMIMPYLIVKRIQAEALLSWLMSKSNKSAYNCIIYNDKYALRKDKSIMRSSNLEILCHFQKLEKSLFESVSQSLKPSFDNLTHSKLNSISIELRENLSRALTKTPSDIIIDNKKYLFETVRFRNPISYYESLLFNPSLFNPKTFGVRVIPIDRSDQALSDIWKWIHSFTASYKTGKRVGRWLRFLVQEETTRKYLGIISLGSDFKQYGVRDNYIGWNKENREKRLTYLANIATCIPVQPFGYNLNGGKLLAMLCFSDDVIRQYNQKYNTNLAMLTTFSLNGKGIMYDRLRGYLKFIGMSKGSHVDWLPERLYQNGKILLKDLGKTLKDVDKHYWRKYVSENLASFLDINIRGVKQNTIRRGIYIGTLGQGAISFMRGEIGTFQSSLKSTHEITDEWINRWAIQRKDHLILKNRYGEENP